MGQRPAPGFRRWYQGTLRLGIHADHADRGGCGGCQRGTPAAELELWRNRCIGLLCIAGHADLPQVSLPLATQDGCPLGLSLLAARGNDTMLLELAGNIHAV